MKHNAILNVDGYFSVRDIIILARKKFQRCFFVPHLQQMCEREEVCVVKRVCVPCDKLPLQIGKKHLDNIAYTVIRTPIRHLKKCAEGLLEYNIYMYRISLCCAAAKN